MAEVDLSVDKGAERLSELTICRSRGGIRLYGRVHAMLEDLIKSWSSPQPVPVATYGRHWEDKSGKPLDSSVWELTANPGILTADGGTYYCLDRVGMSLIEDRTIGVDRGDGRRLPTSMVLNLSYLRLVGISDEGIDLTMKGVFSTDEVLRAAASLKAAMRHIAVQYIKPVDLTVIVSMQRNL